MDCWNWTSLLGSGVLLARTKSLSFPLSHCLPCELSQMLATLVKMADQLKEGHEAMKCKQKWYLLQLPSRISFGSLAFWCPTWRIQVIMCSALPLQQLCTLVWFPLSLYVCGLHAHWVEHGAWLQGHHIDALLLSRWLWLSTIEPSFLGLCHCCAVSV